MESDAIGEVIMIVVIALLLVGSVLYALLKGD